MTMTWDIQRMGCPILQPNKLNKGTLELNTALSNMIPLKTTPDKTLIMFFQRFINGISFIGGVAWWTQQELLPTRARFVPQVFQQSFSGMEQLKARCTVSGVSSYI